jgi:hypothetical protein
MNASLNGATRLSNFGDYLVGFNDYEIGKSK